MRVEEIKRISDAACREFDVKRLDAFGSIARGTSAPSSDVDLLVEFRNPEDKPAGRVLDKIDDELAANPQRFPSLTGPFAGLRKFRVGDYRVIFAIMDDDVLILRVQHRKDVYRG